MAGYRELAAIEWDQSAVATLHLNFPDIPIYRGDICGLTGEALMKLAGIEQGDLDVLDGSPPCQGFSTVGKRKMKDARNGLFAEFSRLLRELQPRAFVMENVAGMVQGKMSLVFLEALRALKSAGYRVTAQLMDSSYFNVPQTRRRLIFIGVRLDQSSLPSHPAPEAWPITIREAVEIPSGTIGYVTASNERHSKAGIRPMRKLSQPMATLVATGNSRMMQGYLTVKLSMREAARFGSFPDAFAFVGDWQKQIGNSVPPLFMKAIAEHVKLKVLSGTP
jgi:DNA (cytosine-5)-methyltransferase 1